MIACHKCKRRPRYARNLCGACWKSESTAGRLAQWPKHRAVPTHCKRGHEFTPENTVISYPVGRPQGRRSCRQCKRDAQSQLLSNKNYRMVHKYGMSEAEYTALLERQGGVCAACRRPPTPGKRLDIDHDHQCCGADIKRCGRCNRGLLCSGCNWALGNAGDSPDRLRALAAYLEAWQAREQIGAVA